MNNLFVKLEEKNTEIKIFKNIYFDNSTFHNNGIVITDSNLILNPKLEELAKDKNFLVLNAGEEYKTLESIEMILKKAIQKNLDRSSVIFGIGGGVVCDMTAFAASIYMRGCKLVLVPTTLLSMVDASIGGKTGIDYLDKKNLLGTFYPASEVYIFTDFLKTLSEKEFKSGLAEILKHAFLSGMEFLDYIEINKEKINNREDLIMEEIIYKSLTVKAKYIQEDFREKGIRKHLNLGHTFGHALESALGLGNITHGEAVAWGIYKSVCAGVLLGITNKAYARRVEKVLKAFGYNLFINDFNHDSFFNALKADKKKQDGDNIFIVQKNISDTGMYQLSKEVIKRVISTSFSMVAE